MLKIRVVKTASDSKAVQIVYYADRRTKIFKHVGSAKSQEQIEELKLIASDLIENISPILPLDSEPKFNNFLIQRRNRLILVLF